MGYAPSGDVFRSELSEDVWESVAMVELQLTGPGGLVAELVKGF